MTDRRDPLVLEAIGELAESAPPAPRREDIEGAAADRSSPTIPAPQAAIPAWGVALIAAAVAMASIGGTVWFLGRDAGVADTPATTTIPVPTTLDPGDTTAVEALLGEYHEAYNAGDIDAVFDLLSGAMREISPGNLRYWVDALGEQVEATCTPSPTDVGTVLCTETYTDVFHGPAGLSIRAEYLYSERDGRVQQIPNPASPWLPGCLENRCPGEAYREYEEALFDWLVARHPEIAREIGSAVRLGYFSGDFEAAAAALPYVGEFLAENPRWRDAGVTGIDLTGMTAAEAVDAYYAALNGRDAAAYSAFFGREPEDALEFLWALGTQWVAACEPLPGGTKVRCEEEMVDDFYTRAGAVFRFTRLITLSDGELTIATERELSSHTWAYEEFEPAFGAWLRGAHPAEHDAAFAGSWMVRNPGAAGIALRHVDEFLEQSDVYPRDPGAVDQ